MVGRSRAYCSPMPPKEIKMKFRSFLLILVALLFFGCASSPEVSDKEPIATETVVEEVQKEPVEIITTVYYPVKVDSYFGDGVKDEYTVYSYNEDGSLLLKEELFSTEDSLQQSVVFEYTGTESSVKSIYDGGENLLSYELNLIDIDGNTLKKEKFDSKDVLQSKSEYEFKDGKKITWKVFNETGSLLSTTNYNYTNDVLTRIDSLSPAGELEEYFDLQYDSNGLLLENKHFNSEGQIQDSRSFEYKDGFLVMELVNRKNGSVLRKLMYKNDQFGNPVETIYMDAGDNVQERLITIYESREEISYEK